MAAPSLPSPSKDFGAFTRPRGAEKVAAVPELAELAEAEAPELASIGGGECPSCKRPHGDDDRHCQFCGAQLRRACGKCDRPLRGEQQFCPTCGIAAPPPGGAPPPPAALHLVPPPAPVDTGPDWETDDLFFVAAGVEMILVRHDGDLLEEKARDRINSRAAAVANKHFRIGGRWKEEIALGMSIAGALFPTLWIYYVVEPRERAEAREAARAAGKGAA